MAARLTNRFETYRRLQPERSEFAAALVELVRSLGLDGSVFHVIQDVPEQGEDLVTLLSDDQTVISFEVPRGRVPLEAEEVIKIPVAEYRHKIGQGKDRIRLDETLKHARVLLGR